MRTLNVYQRGMAFEPGRLRLAVVSSRTSDNTLELIDTGDGHTLHSITVPFKADEFMMTLFNDDGSQVALFLRPGLTVRAWNTATGEPVPAEPAELAGRDTPDSPVPHLADHRAVVQSFDRLKHAVPSGNRVQVIDLRPPDEREKAYRRAVTRPPLAWHERLRRRVRACEGLACRRIPPWAAGRSPAQQP